MPNFTSDNMYDEFDNDNFQEKSNSQKIAYYNSLLSSENQLSTDTELLEEAIQFYIDQHLFEEALPFAQQLITYSPYSTEGWVYQGIIFNNTMQYSEAIESYTKALALNPYDVAIHINLGITFDNANQSENAIEQFNEVLLLDSENEEALISIMFWFISS